MPKMASAVMGSLLHVAFDEMDAGSDSAAPAAWFYVVSASVGRAGRAPADPEQAPTGTPCCGRSEMQAVLNFYVIQPWLIEACRAAGGNRIAYHRRLAGKHPRRRLLG